MQISELIQELENLREDLGDDVDVMSSSDYGDYHHTEQLSNIKEISICVPVKSAYSGTSLAYPKDMEEEDCDMEDDAKRVIVLRYKCQ